MYDMIIIGGGPAALSAAFYALEKRLNVVMLYEELGGKVGWRESLVRPDVAEAQLIEARQHMQADEAPPSEMKYLPANELVRVLISRITQEARVIHDRALAIAQRPNFFSVQTAEQGVLQATALVVATGASPLLLNVPGAQRLIDRAMGYSLTTYAHVVAGQRVAVIGATRRALMGTAEFARTAAQVTLIVPGAGDLTPLGEALRGQANVEVLAGYEVTAVTGQSALEQLIVVGQGEMRTLDVDRAFVDLGLVPNSGPVRGMVATDDRGYIIVDQRNATSVPGLFAAGDVTTAPVEQVLIAIGDGARAAMNAYEYVLTQRIAEGRLD